MQVFLLHEEPDESAKALCDKHVPKLTLEAVQIANTGLHLAGYEQHAFYGATHTDHPWCEFAAESFDHWHFVVRRAQALGREFLRRYDDRHTSHLKITQNWTHDDLRAIERDFSDAERLTASELIERAPQAMPEQYQQEDPIEAYRAYYYGEKLPQRWCFYEQADPPDWFVQGTPLQRWH